MDLTSLTGLLDWSTGQLDRTNALNFGLYFFFFRFRQGVNKHQVIKARWTIQLIHVNKISVTFLFVIMRLKHQTVIWAKSKFRSVAVLFCAQTAPVR